MERIDMSDGCDMHCYRTDHNLARVINQARRDGGEKHGDNHMDAHYVSDDRYMTILIEEVGEIADVINELALGRLNAKKAQVKMAKEIIDVLAVAGSWLDRLRAEDNVPYPTKAWLA